MYTHNDITSCTCHQDPMKNVPCIFHGFLVSCITYMYYSFTNTCFASCFFLTDIEETFQLSPMDSIFLVSEDILLDCTPPSSYPTPTISWLKDSVTVMGNKYTILNNGSLMVTGVELSDKGSYACKATNEYLNITRTSSPATVSIHRKYIHVHCIYEQ